MGFFEALFKSATDGLKKMNEVRLKYEMKSDEECARAFWRNTGMEKGAAFSALKNRYGEAGARDYLNSHRC